MPPARLLPASAASPSAASYDETAKLWDSVTGQILATLQGHTNYINSIAFSPDGTKIGTASFDRTAKIWDFKAWLAYSQALADNMSPASSSIILQH